jgi:CheY-like chemotaxis protein
MITQDHLPSTKGQRIVICDYNALLLSVTGLLRMSDYAVFQAHDGYAAQELCTLLPDIDLLILNTYGTGIDVGELCRNVRSNKQSLPILHIGSSIPDGLPEDVPTLAEDFTSESLLRTVRTLVIPTSTPDDPALNYPNGRRREDSGPRPATLSVEPVRPCVAPLAG